MTCQLNIHEEYPLNSVQFDKGTGKVAVHLSNPPPTCTEGFYTNKAATIDVDSHLTVSKWTYTNHPVVLVPSKSMVQVIDSTPPSSFGGLGLVLVLALLAAAGWYAWKNGFFARFASNTGGDNTPPSNGGNDNNSKRYDTTASSSPEVAATPVVAPVTFPRAAASSVPPLAPSTYRRGGTSASNVRPHEDVSTPAPVIQQVPVQQPVIVNNSGPGFFTGMMVGSMMNGGGHSETIIHDREVIHDGGSRADYSRSDDAPRHSRSDDDYSRSDDSRSSSRSDDTPQYSRSDSSNDYSSSDSSNDYSSSDSSSDYSSSDSSGGSDFSSSDS
jgi:hypothetical protein